MLNWWVWSRRVWAETSTPVKLQGSAAGYCFCVEQKKKKDMRRYFNPKHTCRNPQSDIISEAQILHQPLFLQWIRPTTIFRSKKFSTINLANEITWNSTLVLQMLCLKLGRGLAHCCLGVTLHYISPNYCSDNWLSEETKWLPVKHN